MSKAHDVAVAPPHARVHAASRPAPPRPFARPADSWRLDPAAGEARPLSLQFISDFASARVVQPASARMVPVRAHALPGGARPAALSVPGPGGLLQRTPSSEESGAEQSEAVDRDARWWAEAAGFGLLGVVAGAYQSIEDLVVGVYESVVDIFGALPAGAEAAGSGVLAMLAGLEQIPDLVRAIPDLADLAPAIQESLAQLVSLLLQVPAALRSAFTLEHMKSMAKQAWDVLATTVEEATKPMFDPSPRVAGMFVGELLGYAAVEVLLAIFSGGGAAAVKVATKARKLAQMAKGARFLDLVRKLVRIVEPLLEKARLLVQKASKLLDELAAKLRRVLSKKADAPGKGKPGKGKEDEDGNSLPTGKAGSPIPITFYKVDGLYQPIELEGHGGKRETYHPFDKKALPTPRMRKTADQVGAEAAESGKGIIIGISNWNRPSVLRVQGAAGMPLRRVSRPDGNTPAARSFRTALASRGARLANMAIDHVHDLALSGHDVVPNLWPLDATVNGAANKTYDQRVTYRDGKQTRSALVRNLTGKYVKITRIASPK